MSDFKFVIGGTEYDLADDYSIRVTGWTGGGMPPTDNIATRYAIADGAEYQRTIAAPRSIQLACVFEFSSQYDFHAKRRAVVAAINRDVLSSGTFVLRYSGAEPNTDIDINVRYDGGLELDRQAADPLQPFAIRLLAVDPYWSYGTNSASMAHQASVADANYILMRGTDGAWQAMGGGLSGEVFEIACDDASGKVYVGGDFTTAYNAAGGGSPITVNNIAVWDGSQWAACGAGVVHTTATAAVVKAIAIDDNGYVYVGGLFTTAGTAAIDSIAVYDPETNTWPGGWTFNGGVSGGAVRAIAVDAIGDVWIGGEFTAVRQPGGAPISGQSYLAKWDLDGLTTAGNYATIFTTAPNSYIYALEMESDGMTPIIGGNYATVNGLSRLYISRYVDGNYAAMGAGVNYPIYSLEYGPDQTLYAGGAFSQADGMRARHSARWNGSGWAPVGVGLGTDSTSAGEVVRDLAIGSDGTIYAMCPSITTAGGVTLVDQCAQYDGGAWSSLDIDLPGTPEPRAVAVDSDGRLYVGFNTAGTAIAPSFATVNSGVPSGLLLALTVGGTPLANAVLNPGTAKAYPTITITRTGGTSATLQSIRNWTTGEAIVAPISIYDGESIVFDLAPGAKTVSSDRRSNLLGKVLSGSDLMSFGLAPGANDIATFIVTAGSPAVTVTIDFANRNWSTDV